MELLGGSDIQEEVTFSMLSAKEEEHFDFLWRRKGALKRFG